VANKVAALYNQEMSGALFSNLQEFLTGKSVDVFFRADDIGVLDTEFVLMMELFRKYRVPLCLAVVPLWMSRERWLEMTSLFWEEELWCWHQHGYAHKNYESSGKKNEFGSSRSMEEIRNDLQQGRDHLEAVLGDIFCPVFTPPWNRCSRMTLDILADLNFQAVSRSIGVKTKSEIPDFCINVDLHTGKEKNLQPAMDQLLNDWKVGVEHGRLGIMLHHQRMNSFAFAFLERLLQLLQGQAGVTFVTFRELAAKITPQYLEAEN
jgi:peptidoglycan/xylan/chitin deacetylase (PgdA/CDA1 family)